MAQREASTYGKAWEDIMGAATLLQNHEAVLRPAFAKNPKRANEILEMANNLFDAIDSWHHDVTSGGEA